MRQLITHQLRHESPGQPAADLVSNTALGKTGSGFGQFHRQAPQGLQGLAERGGQAVQLFAGAADPLSNTSVTVWRAIAWRSSKAIMRASACGNSSASAPLPGYR